MLSLNISLRSETKARIPHNIPNCGRVPFSPVYDAATFSIARLVTFISPQLFPAKLVTDRFREISTFCNRK